jgi:hypothetical protein
VGWLLWVSWLVRGVLFLLGLRLVAVGWQVWISWVVRDMLFGSVLGVAGVG